jgi:hypothetical protein
VSQDVIKPLDLQRKLSVVTEPKEDDPGMGELHPNNELPEVQIGGDEDALLCVGNGEDPSIGQPLGVLFADPDRIMAKRSKVWDQASVSALEGETLPLAAERSSERLATLTPPASDRCLRVRQHRFHILDGQLRIGSEELLQVWVVRQVP